MSTLPNAQPSDVERNLLQAQITPESEGRFVLACPREMEWKARVDLVDTLRQATAGAELAQLIVSLEGVTCINSAGIGSLFTLRKYLSQHGGAMVVCGANPAVTRLLETVNLPALIPTVADLQAARNFLEEDGVIQ